jgi:carbon-monoxide dehydrogenase medium subunit
MREAHPGLPDFDYVRPASLQEASRFLAENPGVSRPFMGGTDTFVRLRDGFWKETRFLVDVKNLDGSAEITFDPEVGLTLGAAVSMNRVVASSEVNQHYPLLARAAHRVASYQLRSRATIVGNLCNASPAGDTLGASLLFGGILRVHGVEGFRDEPLATFFQGPGRTALSAGDIVTSLRYPVPPAGSVGHYEKLGRNALSDLAIVGVTALGHPEATAPSGFRFHLALASVAPVPLVLRDLLTEEPVTPEALEAVAQRAMDSCNPIDDVRGSARYRKYMVRNLSRRALAQVWEGLQNR